MAKIPHVPHDRAHLVPFMPDAYKSRRFLRCEDILVKKGGPVAMEGCREVFWWDGPSVLTPGDPQRKRGFTDRLVPLSAEQVEALVRT